MKRLVLSLIALFLVVALTGCIIIPRYHRFEIDESAVFSIEIYDICQLYESDLYQKMTYMEYFEKRDVVYEISADQTGEFLKDLAEIEFRDDIVIIIAAIDPSFSYNTWTVRINYSNGSSEFISSAGYGETYDKNGEFVSGTGHHWGCDQDEWLGLIEKYVPESALSHIH